MVTPGSVACCSVSCAMENLSRLSAGNAEGEGLADANGRPLTAPVPSTRSEAVLDSISSATEAPEKATRGLLKFVEKLSEGVLQKSIFPGTKPSTMRRAPACSTSGSLFHDLVLWSYSKSMSSNGSHDFS